MRLVDLAHQAFGEVRHLLLEVGDGLFEAEDFGLGVGVEPVEELRQFGGVAQLDLRERLAVLEENGLAGVLEDGVLERIAFLLLAGDLGVQVVRGVLGLPVAAGKVVAVEDGGVGTDEPSAGASHPVFGGERPALGQRVGEQILEGRAERALVRYTVLAVLFKLPIVVPDAGVGRRYVGRARHEPTSVHRISNRDPAPEGRTGLPPPAPPPLARR